MEPMPTTRIVPVSLSLLLAAALFPGAAAGQKAPKRERNLIAREELLQAADKFTDLYQAIRSLRPHFLTVNNRGVRTSGVGEGAPKPYTKEGTTRATGTGGSSNMNPVPMVYVDGRKSGEPDILKGLLTRDIDEVRYLTPNDAGMEYGLGHEGGAIVVKTFSGQKPPG